jgi:hypothetical protein
MIAYMLAVGIYLGVRYHEYDTIPKHVLKDRAVLDGFTLGIAHAVLVALAAAATWRPQKLTTTAKPLLAWTVGLPALAAMLAVNFGFGLALRFLVEVVGGQKVDADEVADLGYGDGWVAVVLVCVQPAVVGKCSSGS